MKNSGFTAKKAGLIIATTLCLVVGVFFLIRYLGEGKDLSGDRVVYVTDVAALIGQEVSGGIVNRYGGVVESQETWSCTANPEYKIKSVLVEVGQEVSEGQALFVYDVNNLQNTLEQQKIDLERLKAELDSIVTTINTLEKESKSADKTVKAGYTIQIQQQQLEKKQKEFDIQAKQKEIEATEENIANQAVTSQIAGVVQSINNPETQSADYQNGDSSFIKIIKTGELRIKGSVNEQNIGLLTEGMPVIVRSRVDSKQVWRGTITKIDRENQQTNGYASMYGSDNGSGTNYPFYVDLPTSEGLMMGQHVYLEPDLGQEDENDAEGIWLNEWYVDESVDDAPFVWVDDGNGKLTKRDVVIGERDSDMETVQILSGLELADLIAFPDENCAEGIKTEKTDMPVIGADGGGFDEEESGIQFDPEEDGGFEEYYGDVGTYETEEDGAAGGDPDEDFDGVTFDEEMPEGI